MVSTKVMLIEKLLLFINNEVLYNKYYQQKSVIC